MSSDSEGLDIRQLKRRLAHAEAERNELRQTLEKQKPEGVPEETSKPIKLGRRVCRYVALFTPCRAIIDEADRRAELRTGNSPISDASIEARSTSEQKTLWKGYQELKARVPTLLKVIDETEVRNLHGLWIEVAKGATSARSADICRLKNAVVPWLRDYYKRELDAPIVASDKSDRGLENNDIARLIIPPDWDWDEPSIRSQIQAGADDFQVTSKTLPRFIWSEDEFDSEDLEQGMFKGILAVKAYLAIFISPTASDDISNLEDDEPPRKKTKKPATKKGNAALTRAKHVTPRSIAYTITLLRFALSESSSWTVALNDFDYEDFYNFILAYFEEPVGAVSKAHVEQLLLWWDKKVYGVRKAVDLQTGIIYPSASSSTVDQLTVQRCRKEATRY